MFPVIIEVERTGTKRDDKRISWIIHVSKSKGGSFSCEVHLKLETSIENFIHLNDQRTRKSTHNMRIRMKVSYMYIIGTRLSILPIYVRKIAEKE